MWPLHPRPYLSEGLRRLVERTAAAYDIPLASFCFYFLNMSRQDAAAMWFENPTSEVLARLSDGTGLPVDELENMSGANLNRRIKRACDELMSTAEGRAAVDAFNAACRKPPT